MTNCIVFWQRMLTPHMTALAREVAGLGTKVHYVAERELSDERKAMGWTTDDMPEVELHYIHNPKATRALVDSLPINAVHITQGLRANGLVADAQTKIMDQGLRHYPILEKLDLRGPAGLIKPLVYAHRIRTLSSGIEGVLAIGKTTPGWIVQHAPKGLRVFEFAYFLVKQHSVFNTPHHDETRFVFVGSLIKRKRVDLLLDALALLSDRTFTLDIVGDGSERARLEQKALKILPGRVRFLGTVAMKAAIERIRQADCLVLPSDHDGWGAVVSEAQINGTPAICSSECGVAGTVAASNFGGVFKAGDVEDLYRVLKERLDSGPPKDVEREKLASWAQCLTAGVGAHYLVEILDAGRSFADGIIPPWERSLDCAGRQ